MKVELKKNGELYDEFITYMSYRYAIGLTNRHNDWSERKLEQYRLFEQIEFDTPEFHALADEIAQYLKRKKIATIVDLRNREIEQQLTWFAYHYAMGRHSYAASLCDDIACYAPHVMSKERQEFTGVDIRREIAEKLRWHTPSFYMPLGYEDEHGPLDTLFQFMVDNEINTKEKMQKYKKIELVRDYSNGAISFRTEKEEDGKNSWFSMIDLQDLIGWEDLSFYLDSRFHKYCRVRYNGKEEIVKYLPSWNIQFNRDDTFTLEKVKRPIDRKSQYRRSWLVEEYVVEDDVKVEHNNVTRD